MFLKLDIWCFYVYPIALIYSLQFLQFLRLSLPFLASPWQVLLWWPAIANPFASLLTCKKESLRFLSSSIFSHSLQICSKNFLRIYSEEFLNVNLLVQCKGGSVPASALSGALVHCWVSVYQYICITVRLYVSTPVQCRIVPVHCCSHWKWEYRWQFQCHYLPALPVFAYLIFPAQYFSSLM